MGSNFWTWEVPFLSLKVIFSCWFLIYHFYILCFTSFYVRWEFDSCLRSPPILNSKSNWTTKLFSLLVTFYTCFTLQSTICRDSSNFYLYSVIWGVLLSHFLLQNSFLSLSRFCSLHWFLFRHHHPAIIWGLFDHFWIGFTVSWLLLCYSLFTLYFWWHMFSNSFVRKDTWILFHGIYTTILVSHKKNEVLLFATTWVDLEGMVQCEISRTETHNRKSHLCVEYKKQNQQENETHRSRKALPGATGDGGWNDERWSEGTVFQLYVNKPWDIIYSIVTAVSNIVYLEIANE